MEYDKIRCDIVVFINGLPLVVIELKSPANDNVEEEDAYLQIKQYQQKCPSLFVYNAFSVTSDMLTSKAGPLSTFALPLGKLIRNPRPSLPWHFQERSNYENPCPHGNHHPSLTP